MDQTCVIGIDFGTLSARAVVVRVRDSAVVGQAVGEYRHGVMDRVLSAGDGRALPPGFALQVPRDYLDAMVTSVRGAMAVADVEATDVVGIGIDATSATVLATDAEGQPLCERDAFVNDPQAYMKLWKHHGAKDQAEDMTDVARTEGEPWLARYGGSLSSELLLPKALELLQRAPDVYAAADEILDVVDWLTWRLSGVLVYAAGDSGYKRLFQDGRYPSEAYLVRLDPRFGSVYREKMAHPVVSLGSRAGSLRQAAAEALGLPAGIAVAVGNVDAHVHALAVDAVRPGQLTGILGTSVCWVVCDEHLHEVPGVFGAVDGGVVDGLWGYEAGQTAVGDSFAWFVDHAVPQSYASEAQARGVPLQTLLDERAAQLDVGASGLIALDWMNGNRSILVDPDLSGLLIGQTLTTRPEEIYRALLESCAFGARVIIENFEEHGIPVGEIRAAGGLLRSGALMQMYADVTRRPIATANNQQAGAFGAAITAAVAAGLFPTLRDGADAMGGVQHAAYRPDPRSADAYDRLYQIYRRMYQLFGVGDSSMHDLASIRREVAEMTVNGCDSVAASPVRNEL